MEKRIDYLSWDEYFMGIAFLSALRSKDPSTQVGACIVDEDKKIIGIGYNGFPMGSSDDDLSWDKTGEYLDTKYPYVVHAELNAILNSIKSLKGCTIYVSLFPCNECAKAIVQSGIKKVDWLNIEVLNNDLGIPFVKLYDLNLINAEIKVSISHSNENAIAYAIIEKIEEKNNE